MLEKKTDFPEAAKPAFSLATANSKQLLKRKNEDSIAQFQIHPHDTGSPAVQRTHPLVRFLILFLALTMGPVVFMQLPF